MSKQSRSILLAYNKCLELAIKFQNILDSFHHLDDGDVLVDSEVTAEKVTLTFSGNKVIEIPVAAGGAGLTDGQAADLQANTNARHPHLNLSVLDMFGVDAEGKPTFNGNAIDTVIAQRDVYDALDSDNNAISLSAKQGKVLKDLIDTLTQNLANSSVRVLEAPTSGVFEVDLSTKGGSDYTGSITSLEQIAIAPDAVAGSHSVIKGSWANEPNIDGANQTDSSIFQASTILYLYFEKKEDGVICFFSTN